MNKNTNAIVSMDVNGTIATVDICGVIGDWEACYSDLKLTLQNIPQTIEEVHFTIYSPGGSVADGNAIANLIQNLPQKTVSKVQVAASMATIIALACDERHIASNGWYLVHNPWSSLSGDSKELAKQSDFLRKLELQSAEYYASKTGKTTEEMLALMSEEKWLLADEAKDWGFVETIDNEFSEADRAQAKADMIAAGSFPVALVRPNGETQKGEKNESDDTTGTEGDGKTEQPDTKQPAKDEPESKDEPEKQENGKDQPADGDNGQPADSVVSDTQIAAIKAEAILQQAEQVALMQAKLVKRDALIASLQSLSDKAKKENKNLRQKLEDMQSRLSKLIAGGLKFAPSVETWEQALQDCNNDYAKARRKHPQAYADYMRLNRS